jgi:hypothetical protein
MPQRLDLLQRRELGDDRVYTYAATYGGRKFVVEVGFAPNDKISRFYVQAK